MSAPELRPYQRETIDPGARARSPHHRVLRHGQSRAQPVQGAEPHRRAGGHRARRDGSRRSCARAVRLPDWSHRRARQRCRPHRGLRRSGRVVAMARPTRSEGLYAQCVGRGTRLAEGKRDCLILDFVDVSALSLCTLPSLFGCPRDLDLRGEDPRDAARVWDQAIAAQRCRACNADAKLHATAMATAGDPRFARRPRRTARARGWLARRRLAENGVAWASSLRADSSQLHRVRDAAARRSCGARARPGAAGELSTSRTRRALEGSVARRTMILSRSRVSPGHPPRAHA